MYQAESDEESLLNPFITEPLAVFLLLVNNNLGVIN